MIEYSGLHLSIVDKYKRFSSGYDRNTQYDFAFICVDTPATDKSVCDISEVISALSEYDAKIYILKIKRVIYS